MNPTVHYLDSSVFLRRLLRESGSWPAWDRADSVHTCQITKVEIMRSVDRLRLSGRLADDEIAELIAGFYDVEKLVSWIQVTPSVLEIAAEPFPTFVKSLAAVHIAAARVFSRSGKNVVFVTHDKQQSTAAKALGFVVEGC